jgi:predicted nucleic acid-binding protein
MANEAATILDPCVFLNLAASDEFAEIVATIPGATFICTAVQKEALFLRDEAEPAVSVPLHVNDLLSAAQIQVCDVASDDEEERFVELAADLDDGEAMSIAIATSRGMTFASDDQKARRIFIDLAPDPQRLTSTPAIMKQWAAVRPVTPHRLRDALRRIGVRARFAPSRRDPDTAWWQQAAT